MNKVILTTIVTLFLAGITAAQTIDVPEKTPEQKATEQEYLEVIDEWKDLMGFDKNSRESEGAIHQIYENIKEEFPMDPEIQKQVEEIQKQRDEDMEAAAKAAGFSSADEAWRAGNTEVQEIYTEAVAKITPLSQPYYNELGYRYHLAAIDALKRMIENANAMK